MAELNLSPAEKTLPLSEWNDADLGRAVKFAMLKMKDKQGRNKQFMLQISAANMIDESVQLGWKSSRTELDIFNYTTKKNETWEIVCRKQSTLGKHLRNFFFTLFPFLK